MSLKERLPNVLPLFDPAATISALIDAHDDELNQIDAEVAGVQDSLFVNTADGQSLDLIGDDFGPLGQRRGRDDTAYRQFLRSFVPAFDGRGTERDVEVAVAAGVATTPDEIDLRQQFADTTYQLELFDWSAHRTGTVHDLADLADPAAVERIDPLYYFSGRVRFGVTAAATRVGDQTVSETAAVAAAPQPTADSVFAVGLSADDLGPLSGEQFILSLQTAPAADFAFITADTEFATAPRLPVASPAAGASGTAIRPMTRAPAARTAVGSAATQQSTLATAGLSSLERGAVSTTNFGTLST